MLEKRFAKTAEKEESIFKKMLEHLQGLLRPLSEKSAKNKDYMGKTRKLLLQAGYASNEEDVINFETKNTTKLLIGVFVCLCILILDASMITIAASCLFLYVIYKLPQWKLKGTIKKRQKEFMKYLPDAVDLLAICVQAGIGIDAAFDKVAQEFKITSETVSTEFGRLNKDILSGINRQDAYKNLILRNENQDLQSFVALLIQSDKLGTSITQSLDAFCDSMRTKRRQRVEELSQQASTKMTIPMVLFMLPAIFIIIMYPAIQKIMASFGGS